MKLAPVLIGLFPSYMYINRSSFSQDNARQLTWSVSKLKNIEFDEFPEWQVQWMCTCLDFC